MNDTSIYDFGDEMIWYNGNLTKPADAKLHVLSNGLHYGGCVFEGLRAYDKKIFCLRAHMERFIRSAHLLDFEIPYSLSDLEAATHEVIATIDSADIYIRPVAWRGFSTLGINAINTPVDVVISAWRFPGLFGNSSSNSSMRVDISDWRRPDPRTIPYESKASGLYMISTLAKQQAIRKGCDDALMLDYRGLIAEVTGANIFFIKGNELHTPTPDCFLDGITRKEVIKLAEQRQIPVHTRSIKPEELDDFNGCFIAGTASEVRLVEQIGAFTFSDNSIAKILRDDYTKLVRRDKV